MRRGDPIVALGASLSQLAAIGVLVGVLVASFPIGAAASAFLDIPDDHPARPHLDALHRRGLASGCAAGPYYCPERTVSRAELARLLLRGLYDPGWTPPESASTFKDMSARYELKDWVMAASVKGILEPCQTDLICVDRAVTRAESARMILRTKWGRGYVPPKATSQRYVDVPLSHPDVDWIQQFADEESTLACGTAGGFCPDAALDAAEAGVLVSRTFMLLDRFTPIQRPQCVDQASDPWRVGGQYRDADNGVITDRHFMLARWQGQDFLTQDVDYDMGVFTGLTAAHQRGYKPEDAKGSPGAQIDCFGFGMLINTWLTPHRPIVGGGYNTMYGFRWKDEDEPRPFVDAQGRGTSHLVLQAELAVTQFAAWPNASNDAGAIVGHVGLFAYLRDRTQPELAPIAVLAFVATSNWTEDWFRLGFVAYDYAEQDTRNLARRHPNWFAGDQAGSGVWYASAPIAAGSPNPYVTTIYSEGRHDRALRPIGDAAQPKRFWRAHITPENFTNVVDTVNARAHCDDVGCPRTGYSRDPADYTLEYAGVIAELALLADTYDASATRWRVGDPAKDQGSLGLSGHSFGVYRYHPL